MSAPRLLSPTTTSGGTPVGGSGTPGTIPVWSGTGTTLGNSIVTQVANSINVTASVNGETGCYIVNPNTGGSARSALVLDTAGAQWTLRNNRLNGTFEMLRGASTAMFIDSALNVGIGTTNPTDSGSWTAGRILDVRSGSAGTSSVAYFGDSTRSTNTQIGFYGSGYGFVGTVTNHDFRVLTNNATRGIWSTTSLDISSTAGYGLKLPATPGNGDAQTLDCYQETTWAPTLAGFGGTNPTVTATLTRVGRLVTLTVQMQSTGGAQYSGTLGATTLTVPAGMTPNIPACTNLVNGSVQNLGNVAAYNDGLIYLPTFALTTSFTFFVVTYRV